jgi:6-pyruvoyltetrahydropterin/6-carboxytetrahydropterin synthase
MHTLSRQIRFSVDPFRSEQVMGYNSYASKPCGEGLSFYFSLWVELTSPLDPDTGFVINVSEIDKIVRRQAVPLFERTVTTAMRGQQSLELTDLVLLLGQSFKVIGGCFEVQRLTGLGLELNPFRKLLIQAENDGMFTYSEKFEFAAMHRLWNDRFDEAKNVELFGKCANAAGHGHNYVLEVSVSRERGREANGWICEFEKAVETQFLDLVDHKNLNVDVAGFESLNPTVENLAYFAWERLDGQFQHSTLEKITVWENDRTFCSYTRQ